MSSPIIILGAARSGTKILRDVLGSASDLGVVPFDVNYIWRYGQYNYPSDQLPVGNADLKNQNFIRKHLLKIAVNKPPTGRFIEKTVSNILRVPFVHKVYPDSKFVFILRDARDVVESALRCWRTTPRVGYLYKKLKTFPFAVASSYAISYLNNFVQSTLRIQPNVSSWGPIYDGMQEDVITKTLIEVCAKQWVLCNKAYMSTKSCINAEQIIEINYESLVKRPEEQFSDLCERLEISGKDTVIEEAKKRVHRANIGKSSRLTKKEIETVDAIQNTLTFIPKLVSNAA